MKLTAQRVKMLQTALSVDDALYRRFFRLTEELARRERALTKRRQIVGVYRKRGRGKAIQYDALRILEVEMTPQGTRVVVG